MLTGRRRGGNEERTRFQNVRLAAVRPLSSREGVEVGPDSKSFPARAACPSLRRAQNTISLPKLSR